MANLGNRKCTGTPAAIIDAYALWSADQMAEGWDGYLATFVFDELAGSVHARIAEMQRHVTAVFSRLLTRMLRKPRAPESAPLLPRGFFAPDLPVKKHSAEPSRDPPTNNGLHMHGIILANRSGRLKEPLDLHFERKRLTYLIGTLRTIDLRRIDRSPERATAYALKGLQRSCFGPDHLLVLPRSLDELPRKVLGAA